MNRYRVSLAGVLCTCGVLSAQTELEAPREALMFKSGYSYLYREAELGAGATTTRFRMPAATHGSVWIESADVALKRATARRATIEEKQPITDLVGILRRSIGRDARLRVHVGMGEHAVHYVQGTILRVLDGPSSTPRRNSNLIYPPPVAAAELVVVRVGDRIDTVPVSTVVSVSVAEAGTDLSDWEYTREVKRNVLDIEHEAADHGQRVGLATLSDGLAWTPSYVLDLTNETRARLVGKAVIVNDAEPLRDTRVKLAIGFPNLEFSSVTSSLSPDTTLEAFRGMLGRPPQRSESFVLAQAMSNTGALDSGRARGPAASGNEVAGESSEDLYLYDIGAVTLDRGERAYVPLVDANITIAHRFDWDLADRVNHARFVTQESDEPTPVWHVVKLDNGTDAPWTTAPILVQNEKGPIAQSMLRYTAAGADATVRMTKALDIVGSTVEVRADDARAPRGEEYLFGSRYERVEVHGVLELTNRSGRTAPVRVRKDFSGDLVSADHEPKLTGRAKRLGQVNASRTAEWSFDLESGATWKAEYRYKVLIRR